MNFLTYLANRWDRLLPLARDHALVTALAVVIATVLGVGLGLVVYDRPRWRQFVIATCSVSDSPPTVLACLNRENRSNEKRDTPSPGIQTRRAHRIDGLDLHRSDQRPALH